MGRPFDPTSHDSMNFLQFAHEMSLGMEAAGGIDDKYLKVFRFGFFASVMSHAGRVASLLTLDNFATEALAPNGELLDRGRPEGVASGHHDFLAVFLTAIGQLGDRCRFSRAIDTGDHHHRRTRRVVL